MRFLPILIRFLRVNEDGLPIEWDQVGTIDEPLVLIGTETEGKLFCI